MRESDTPKTTNARSWIDRESSFSRGPNTSAHEAGHFLGSYSKSATKPWDSRGHTLESDRAEDIKMLMREGGAGWKIRFDLVKEFRDFSG